MKSWTEENTRRKHNYVPFLFNLLRVLARKGALQRIREGRGSHGGHTSHARPDVKKVQADAKKRADEKKAGASSK